MDALGLDQRADRAQELARRFPKASPELIEILDQLVTGASAYRAFTRRYLQVWGELGELYAEIAIGLKRHRPCCQGSDGKLGNDFIEVKKLSPEKRGMRVRVRRAGNFSKLLVVTITADFQFETRLIDRALLLDGGDAYLYFDWS
jgi:hypothetical protein